MWRSPSQKLIALFKAFKTYIKGFKRLDSRLCWEASSSKAATSKRLLHVNATGSVEQSLEAVQAELLEATADSEAEAKALAKELAAYCRGHAWREAVALATEEVADPELRACVAGMAAAEAAYHQGASAEEALHTASHEAMAMAQKLPVELAQQCAALAQGAVIGRAAAPGPFSKMGFKRWLSMGFRGCSMGS